MRIKTALIATAILSAILGAVVAYLVLTVPNDIQAAALMRRAKEQIAVPREQDHARHAILDAQGQQTLDAHLTKQPTLAARFHLDLAHQGGCGEPFDDPLQRLGQRMLA